MATALECVALLTPAAATADHDSNPAPPKLFLTCPQECFDAFLRQELSHFDFVRDPYAADYNFVIVRQQAGNGGERFSLTVVRRDTTTANPTPAAAERSFIAAPGATMDRSRRDLLQLVLRALVAELGASPHALAFELSLPRRSGAHLSELADPWDYWVFAPELRGQAEGGSGSYWAELTSALTVRRITEPSKLRLRGTYSRWLSGYKLEDGSRVRGDVYGWEGRGLYAHSVGERHSLGATAAVSGNEFENLKSHIHGGPLLEFNLFPYSQNASRQLRAAYQAGAWVNWYFEENESRRVREVRPYHALSLIADLNQPWGSIQWVNQANMFLDEPGLYRLSMGAIFTLRLFEGLAISSEGEAAYVRDLINLRARPISDLELLLGTAQQPTRYLFELEFALTYTFGSVHNTIVNPRFGRIDLQEE